MLYGEAPGKETRSIKIEGRNNVDDAFTVGGPGYSY